MPDVWHSFEAIFKGRTKVITERELLSPNARKDAEALLDSDLRKAFVQEFAKEPRIKGFEIETVTIKTNWLKQFDLPDGAVWVGEIDATVTFSTLVASSPIEPATIALITAILTFVASVVTAVAYVVIAYFAYQTVTYLGEKAPAVLGLGAVAVILVLLFAMGVRFPKRKEEK